MDDKKTLSPVMQEYVEKKTREILKSKKLHSLNTKYQKAEKEEELIAKVLNEDPLEWGSWQKLDMRFYGKIVKALGGFEWDFVEFGKVENSRKLSFYVDNTNVGTLEKLDVEQLLKFAKPSPFGHGKETVYDKSVRHGLQINTDRMHIQYDNSFEKCTIGKWIVDHVMPEYDNILQTGKQWVVKPYKMHIYEKGGFFLAHRDTPHDAKHVATLVIGIPSEHTGGGLVIHSPYKEDFVERVSFGESKDLQYAMFYTDCLHEVEEIKSGTRIVIQADLYVEKNPDYEKHQDDYREDYMGGTWIEQEGGEEWDTPIANMDTLASHVRSYIKRKEKRAILMLSHCYIESGLRRDLLRGSDRKLWNYMTNPKNGFIGAELASIAVKHNEPYEGGECDERFDAWIIRNNVLTKGERPTLFVSYNSHMRCVQSQSSGFTGNEAEDGFSTYYFGGIILDIPRKK